MRCRYRQMVSHPLHRAEGAAIINAKDRGAGEDFDVFQAGGVDLIAVRQGLAAQCGGFFAKDDAPPCLARFARGLEASFAAAYYQNIAEFSGFFVSVRVRLGGGAAEAGGAADHRLVEFFPEGGGPHEGFVVETGGEKWRQMGIDAEQIVLERGEAILAAGGETVEQFNDGGAGVGFTLRAGAQFDQGVGLLRTGRENTTRAVIFEGAGYEFDVVGKQGRGQSVACETLVGFAVKAEIERLCAVNEAAGGQAMRGHAASLADFTWRISCVAKLRVTTSQA